MWLLFDGDKCVFCYGNIRMCNGKLVHIIKYLLYENYCYYHYSYGCSLFLFSPLIIMQHMQQY